MRPSSHVAVRWPVLVGLVLALSGGCNRPATDIPAPRAGRAIVVENARAGTSDWGLVRPALQREIEGYASATSVNRGDDIALHVSTAAPTFRLEVFRTGWYGGLGARRVFGPVDVAGGMRPTPSPGSDGLVSCDWPVSYTLATRDAADRSPWPTGVYLARLTESATSTQAYILLVVRDDAAKPDVLFQLPVTTYQAYNFWGGKSLYRWGSGAAAPWGSTGGPPATRVSFDRPYARSTNPAAAFGNGAGEYLANVQPVAKGYPISSAGWDYNMVRWLEREGYDVGYVTNIDVHTDAGRLRASRVFLSQGHDEYWTAQMRDHVEAARDGGVNLAFFSANTAYWQIRLAPGVTSGVPDRVIVAHKDASPDPFASDADPANDRLVTVRFRDAPVSRPEAALKGTQYVLDPFDGDLIVTQASHWVFEGTGLANGQRLVGLLGYEVDGRSGDEPADTVTLTRTPVISQTAGPCVDEQKQRPELVCTPGRFSEMTIYTAPSGAQVFGTGSIQWSWGLDDFNVPALRTSRRSDAAVTITRTVLAAFGARPSPR